MKIHQLPPDVVAKLRSGTAITDVIHCVQELVSNSIDAGATCIAVRLDLAYYKIQVIDDGEGIPLSQMDIIGERYATSKCSSLDDLHTIRSGGFRGEALASLRSVASMMTVESRHKSSKKTFCKIFLQNETKKAQKSINDRASKGTTVTIQGFLYNMPVRKQCLSPALDLEECRRSLERISLMYPNISFSLRCDTTGDICLETKKCRSLLMGFTHLFGRSKSQHMREISFTEEDLRVSGLIGVSGHNSKELQLLYVNRRFIYRCKVHKLINSMLNQVLFTRRKDTPCVVSNVDSPPKSQVRYGMFVLNISCPHDKFDMTFEPRKNAVLFADEEKIIRFVEEAVFYFFKSNNLLQSNGKSKTHDTVVGVADLNKAQFPLDVGNDISIMNVNQALVSLPAKRFAKVCEMRDDGCSAPKKNCIEEKSHCHVGVSREQTISSLGRNDAYSVHTVDNETGAVSLDTHPKEMTPVPLGLVPHVEMECPKRSVYPNSNPVMMLASVKHPSNKMLRCSDKESPVDFLEKLCQYKKNKQNLKAPANLNNNISVVRTSHQSAVQKDCTNSTVKRIHVSRFDFADVPNLKRFQHRYNSSRKYCQPADVPKRSSTGISDIETNVTHQSQDEFSKGLKRNTQNVLDSLFNVGHTRTETVRLTESADRGCSGVSRYEKTDAVLEGISDIQSQSIHIANREECINKNIGCLKSVERFCPKPAEVPSSATANEICCQTASDKTAYESSKYSSPFFKGGMIFSSQTSTHRLLKVKKFCGTSVQYTLFENGRFKDPASAKKYFCKTRVLKDASKLQTPNETSAESPDQDSPEEKSISIDQNRQWEPCSDTTVDVLPTSQVETTSNVAGICDIHPVFQNMLKWKPFMVSAAEEHHIPPTYINLNYSEVCDPLPLNHDGKMEFEELKKGLSSTVSIEAEDSNLDAGLKTNIVATRRAICGNVSLPGNPISTCKVDNNGHNGRNLPILNELQKDCQETGDATISRKRVEDSIPSGACERSNNSDDQTVLEKNVSEEITTPAIEQTAPLHLEGEQNSLGNEFTEVSSEEQRLSELVRSPPEQETARFTVGNGTVTNDDPVGTEFNGWFSKMDPITHRTVFIHKISGNSTFDIPTASSHNQMDEIMKTGSRASHFFLSHDASPFIPRPLSERKPAKPGDDLLKSKLEPNLQSHLAEQEEFTASVKWKGSRPDISGNTIEDLFSNWQNPTFQKPSAEMEITNFGELLPNQKSMYSILNMHRFTKRMFSNLEVIGQVDNKFIACLVRHIDETQVGKKLLVLFDQHAVHERVRLEQLMEDLYELPNASGYKCLKSYELSPPLCMKLKPNETRLLKAYRDDLSRLGVRFEQMMDSDEFIVHSAPLCLSGRLNGELKKKHDGDSPSIVLTLVQEWLSQLEQTRGATSILPKTLVGVLNYRACRGAVKFGDSLDHSVCVTLMQSLALCNLPFQCAHGRPSIAPILDVQNINIKNKRAGPRLWKLSSKNS